MATRTIALRPPLLTLIMFVASFCALAFFLAAVTLARLHTIKGQRVTGDQFHVDAHAVAMLCSLVALYMASIALMLLKGRHASRFLLLVYFPTSSLISSAIFLLVIQTPRFTDFVGLLIFVLVGTPLLYWYLYRKPNVVAYYKAIAALVS